MRRKLIKFIAVQTMMSRRISMRKKLIKFIAVAATALALGFAGLIVLEGRLAEIDKVYGPQ